MNGSSFPATPFLTVLWGLRLGAPRDLQLYQMHCTQMRPDAPRCASGWGSPASSSRPPPIRPLISQTLIFARRRGCAMGQGAWLRHLDAFQTPMGGVEHPTRRTFQDFTHPEHSCATRPCNRCVIHCRQVLSKPYHHAQHPLDNSHLRRP